VSCRRCDSDRRVELGAEVNIHPAGLSALDEPALLVFPTLIACLNCGFVEFNLSEDELTKLATLANERHEA
jgi:hypothetical protein